MPDPLDVLRSPVSPVQPDPVFAEGLRARIERALGLPRGVTVSDLTVEDDLDTSSETVTRQGSTASASASGAVGGRATSVSLNPYLAVAGAERALEWYSDALGARLRGTPYVMPDGTIGHAELELGGSVLMLSEEHPSIGVAAPLPGEGVPVTMHLSVDDVDSLIEGAVRAGAVLEREPTDYEYGRNGVFRDPFGHRWLVSSEPESARHSRGATSLRNGDLGYASLWVPDAGRAAAFFAEVLGWRCSPGSGPQGRQVEGLSISHGLWGGQPRSTLFLCFAVDDVRAAVDRVRAAGGSAGDPHPEPYGVISECTDDQGVAFAVFEPPGGTAPHVGRSSHTSVESASNPGDLAYVTMEVVDSSKTRSFYRRVLGWNFLPGRVEDGWQVEDTVPMVGVSGGHDLATTVPLYRVDDIGVAVSRVRSLGGSATDPETQPYGITATCTDDQGTRFYIGRL